MREIYGRKFNNTDHHPDILNHYLHCIDVKLSLHSERKWLLNPFIFNLYAHSKWGLKY